MIRVQHLITTSARRRADDLAFEARPGRRSVLVVGSMPPLLAEGLLGLGSPTPVRTA